VRVIVTGKAWRVFRGQVRWRDIAQACHPDDRADVAFLALVVPPPSQPGRGALFS
jgi:hypothetical protein